MITLSILKLLENAGFGQIDETLFWEKLGLDNTGLFITDIGASQELHARPSTVFEIYSRGASDVEGYQALLKVRDYLNSTLPGCKLPSVPPITDYGYHNVFFGSLSTIANNGVDENGRVIYSVTGRVYYQRGASASPPATGSYLATEGGIAILTESSKLILTEEA